tara:strand:+ start:9 stop:968 length:960 start_codon:yes stop_codon:yes gene_type:complete
MAETIQRVLPAEYLEALGKTYADQLTTQVGQPVVAPGATGIAQLTGETPEQFAQRQAQAQQFDITKQSLAGLAPQVAAQDALQTAAITQAQDATTGLGSFQPFLTKAGEAATAATGLTGAMTDAQTTAYMSPYQTSVIDTTLTEFDRQAAAQKAQQAAQALGVPGAFGGGREGVLQAEYASSSDRNRAALQAGLLQQGFQQAQQARQQDLQNQLGLANLQSGLGAQAQTLARTQIAGLGTLGATQQAQAQAELDATRQANIAAAQERFDRLGQLGSGVIGLMGGQRGSTTIGQAPPSASPLASALGIGSTLAGIYGAIK